MGYRINTTEKDVDQHQENLIAQGRFFESRFNILKDDKNLTVVFVDRWRDVSPDKPYGYGLMSNLNKSRPAREVVSGVFSGRQTVFAFPSVPEKQQSFPWETAIGWLMLLGFSVYYTNAPRFRRLFPRYFSAHAFYCDGLRNGRDVLPGATLILAFSEALSLGVVLNILFSFGA